MTADTLLYCSTTLLLYCFENAHPLTEWVLAHIYPNCPEVQTARQHHNAMWNAGIPANVNGRTFTHADGSHTIELNPTLNHPVAM